MERKSATDKQCCQNAFHSLPKFVFQRTCPTFVSLIACHLSETFVLTVFCVSFCLRYDFFDRKICQASGTRCTVTNESRVRYIYIYMIYKYAFIFVTSLLLMTRRFKFFIEGLDNIYICMYVYPYICFLHRIFLFREIFH